METNIVGTRMRKTTNQIVDNPFFYYDNNQLSPNYVEDIEGQTASVKNDCQYKFFNPDLDQASATMSIDELNMTMSEYEKYVNSEFSEALGSIYNKDKDTIRTLIASVIKGEAINQDELGRQLVATVLFNRYMHYGKNLCKVIYDSQHEWHVKITDSPSSDAEKNCIKVAEEIFTQSPLAIKGKKTNVVRQVPILVKGVASNGEMTKPITLTAEMLKTMDGYCTTRGYDENDKSDAVKESKGYWHDAKYICQHDTSSAALGHVFVAGAFSKTEIIEHWQETPKKSSDSDSRPSDYAKQLFKAISDTVSYSNGITLKGNLNIEAIDNDADAFYITLEPKESGIDVFDAIVNTYYDYFSNCYWVVGNDATEPPTKIYVRVKKDSDTRKIAVSTIDNPTEPLKKYDGLNDSFYASLKKKYGTVNDENKNTFQCECLNFSELYGNSDWVDTVNLLLDRNIQSCNRNINLPTFEGYSWEGTDDAANKKKPSGTKLTGFDINAAVKKINDNKLPKSVGQCAKYVRIALQEGAKAYNASVFDERPNSACRYAEYLPSWGFSNVYTGFGGEMGSYVPKEGDIIVIQGKKDGISSHLHGHIQIACKENGNFSYISDFAAKTPWCYRDNRMFSVYRWMGS